MLARMKTSANRDAVVIGCGVGGPVVAMALQRVGIDATIYEAYERPADFVGSFLNLASNGIDALRAIGADRAVLDAAFPTPRMVMWSGTGKRLGEVANGIALDDGTTSQTIQRGLLHRALREEAIRRGIQIVQGKRLVGAERTGVGILAAFEDGTQVRAAMLVGADGLHSACRRLIDPAAPSPRYTGLLSLGGRAVTRHLEATPDTFHMMFGKQAFFGYTVRPSGEVYWFANVASAAEPGRGPAAPPAMWKERLRRLFAEDAGPALEIVNATEDDLAAYPIFDMPAVPRWHAGPMVITGDASHATSPSSGQGASLAIEDGVVLAQCLRDTDDVGAAFATFQRLRRPRVERVVRYSARIGRTKSPGPIGRWLRDLCMPAALKVFASPQAHAWLYRYHIDWSARVAMRAGGAAS
jgi:2-polyprenyl-6-methoxyphenol hydroxylase-like FAD-dependent oxidoreductase